MRVADPEVKVGASNLRAASSGAENSLRLAHSVGVRHCDVRAPNLLFFPSSRTPPVFPLSSSPSSSSSPFSSSSSASGLSLVSSATSTSMQGAWQLVDYGHASVDQSRYTLSVHSGQAQRVGGRIRLLVEACRHRDQSGESTLELLRWNESDDYEMLIRLVLDTAIKPSD
jgi:hypothetical protein